MQSDSPQDEKCETAGNNYITSAIQLHKAGKTCGSRPWLRYFAMQKTWKILHVDEGFKDTDAERWEHREEEKKRLDAEPQHDCKAEGKGSQETAQRATPKKRTRAHDSSTGESGKSVKTEPHEDDDKKKTGNFWSQVKALKNQIAHVTSSGADVLAAIKSDKAWEWANNEKTLSPLHQAIHVVSPMGKTDWTQYGESQISYDLQNQLFTIS